MAYIEISKDNYKHNINYLAKMAGGKDKFMVVLKDNAYGHDLKIMAVLSSSFGIKKAAVKNILEAQSIDSLFEEILILADHPPKEKVEENISYAVHSLEGLKKFPAKSAVHINVDTGMHRNGIREEELEDAFEVVLKNNLILKGIFTHFKNADGLGCEQFFQESNYKRVVEKAKNLVAKYKFEMPSFHSCNSAALLRRKTPLEDDFVRCGIATYGYTHLGEFFGKYDLKPVMSLWAEKLSTRFLVKGDRVGYGGVYELLIDGKVSTYDIGYGDGFFRHDGKSSLVLENDKEVLGRVSMDSLAILGDEEKICLFNDAHTLAKHFGTITYDIITKLSPFMKRIIV
jgi:alanine racemase